MNKLVVLGNGFDLNCGLKSSFSHFIDFRHGSNGDIKKFKNMIKNNYLMFKDVYISYEQNPDIKEISFIDKLILVYKNDHMFWSDIEQIIFNLLKPKKSSNDESAMNCNLDEIYDNYKLISKKNI